MSKPRLLPPVEPTPEPEHDLRSEANVLSCCLRGRADVLAQAVELLGDGVDVFYEPSHRLVYGAVLALHRQGCAVDLETVCAELLRRGQLDAVGGYVGMATLIDTAPTSVHVEYYAGFVFEAAQARDGADLSGQLQAAYLERDHERQQDLQSRIAALATGTTRGLQAAPTDDWEARGRRPKDWLVPQWLLRRKVHILGSDPGVGKSQLATLLAVQTIMGTQDLVRDLAAKERAAVLLIDLEDEPDDTFGRIAALKDHHRLGADYLDTSIRERLHLVARPGGAFLESKDSGRGWKETPFYRDTLRLARQLKPGLIIIDHLGLLAGEVDGNDTAGQGQVLNRCNVLAQESGACVLLLAHHNKDASRGGNQKNRQARIRGASSITAQARGVMELSADNDGILTLTRTKGNFSRIHGAATLAFRIVGMGDLSCLESVEVPATTTGTTQDADAHPELADAVMRHLGRFNITWQQVLGNYDQTGVQAFMAEIKTDLGTAVMGKHLKTCIKALKDSGKVNQRRGVGGLILVPNPEYAGGDMFDPNPELTQNSGQDCGLDAENDTTQKPRINPELTQNSGNPEPRNPDPPTGEQNSGFCPPATGRGNRSDVSDADCGIGAEQQNGPLFDEPYSEPEDEEDALF